jgi:hypothetical protein
VVPNVPVRTGTNAFLRHSPETGASDAKVLLRFLDHKAFVHDHVGTDLADVPSARRRAAAQARNIIDEGRANGEDRSDWVFEIKDEAAHTVLTMPFSQALRADEDTSPGEVPPAGPHSQRALTNPDSTPGTGMLPPVGLSDDPNMQSTS